MTKNCYSVGDLICELITEWEADPESFENPESDESYEASEALQRERAK